MFLREYCIHKIISHYLFHLPLCWKSQLKGNKLSCLFEGSLLGPTTTGPVYSLSAMLAVTWCDVLKYKPKCNSCYLPHQTYYPLFCLPLPLPPHTRLICHGCILPTLQLYNTSPTILLCFKPFHLFCLHLLFLYRPTNSLFYTYLISTLLKWQAVRNSCGFCGDNHKAKSLNLVQTSNNFELWL